MKPYYEDPWVTIYHADCREVLPSLDWKGVAVVSDPQYGIGFNTQAKRTRKTGLAFGKKSAELSRDPKWKPLQNSDKTPFDPTPLLAFEEAILWGANNYAHLLPPTRGWLVWDKLGDKAPSNFGDCELAWTSFDRSIRVWRQLWRGLARAGEDNMSRNGIKLHACQKPAELMRWCIQFTTFPIILDPYMGSGTTLLAAKDLNRKAIGIEIEESDCEKAALRLSQDPLKL
jgi:site-specific DNA-methyltransferase (adenine-specific)